MNENDLRDLLPDERSLPSSRRRDMKERLMVRIQQEEKASRNHFRLIVAAAAASLIAVGGTAAVIAGNTEDPKGTAIGEPSADRRTPDPSEVERAMQGSGIDDGIRAEHVDCFALEPPQDWSNQAEGWLTIPLDSTVGTEPSLGSDPATADLMAATCLQTYESYRRAPAASFTYEVCVRDAVYPQAVVALAEADCEDADARNPGEGEVRPITDADLDVINHMRAVEYALLAPPEECPTAAQVQAWVARVLDEEDLDLQVTIDRTGMVEQPDSVVTPVPVCPRYAHVDWMTGEVSIEPFRS